MGWSTWYGFGCEYTAESIKAVADAIVASGMRDAGYTYVNIDDCWQLEERDSDGKIQVDPVFPDGIQGLANHVHARGLKLGLYTDRGTQTCAGRAGSEDHEAQDAATFAEWEIDYLKSDNCNSDAGRIEEQYRLMREELDTATSKTGRPIVYSICAWRFYDWAPSVGQLWRTGEDISADWAESNCGGVFDCMTTNAKYAAYAGPNGWNDPDNLQVGNGMSVDEQRTQFNLWAIMSAPLIAGNDLSAMSEETRQILTNKDVIEIDQDAFGLQGVPVRTEPDTHVEIWAKPLNGPGKRAVLLFNPDAGSHDITVRFADLGLGKSAVQLVDLWTKQDLGRFHDKYTVKNVASHASVMLRATGVEPEIPSGTAYLSDLTWIYAANASGPVERDRTAGKRGEADGGPIVLGDRAFEKGLGVAAPSAVLFRLGKACSRLTAQVGASGVIPEGASIVFRVLADDQLMYESARIFDGGNTETIDVDLTGKYRLKLVALVSDPAQNTVEAVWADARVQCH